MEAGAEQPSQPRARSWPPPSPTPQTIPLGGGWKRQTPDHICAYVCLCVRAGEVKDGFLSAHKFCVAGLSRSGLEKHSILPGAQLKSPANGHRKLGLPLRCRLRSLQGLNDPLNLCSAEDGRMAGTARKISCRDCIGHDIACDQVQGNQTGRLLEFVRAKLAAGGCVEERLDEPIVMNGALAASAFSLRALVRQ